MKKSNRLFLKSCLLGILIPLSFSAFAQLHIDADEDVGIGTTNTNNAKLRVYNTSNVYSQFLQNYNSATGTKYGIWNDTRQPSSYTGADQTRGLYNVIYPYGTGHSYGIMNYTYQYGTGQKIGLYNYTMQNTSSTKSTYGVYSQTYPKGSGNGYGTANYVYPYGTGTKYGSYNYVAHPTAGTATSNAYGTWIDVRPYGTGSGYGTYNNVYQFGTGQKLGTYNYVRQSANGTGSVFGTRNNVYPYGTGAAYGSYNTVSNAGTGTRHGVVASVNKTANTSSNTASYGVSVGAYDQGSNGAVYGIYVNSYTKGIGHVRGIYNYISANGTGPKYGIDNTVYATTGSTQNVRGISNNSYLYGSSSSQGLYNGVYTNDNSSGTMIGLSNVLYQYGTGGTGTRYALYSAVSGQTTAGAYAGYFVGDVYATGTVTWGGSDERLKENVEDMNGGLAIIKKLEPKTYTFKKALNLSLPNGKQYGLMAQDLEKVLPGLVSEVEHPGTPIVKEIKTKQRIPNPNPKTLDIKPRDIKEEAVKEGEDPRIQEDETPPVAEVEDFVEVEVVEEVIEYSESTSYKTVRYEALIPVLISAVKEQQKQIELLQKEVAQLKKERKK